MNLSSSNGDLLRTLVVDDDLDTANALGLLLRRLGNEVRTCYEGATAIDVAQAFVPHLAMLDLAMPKVDGLALAKRFRELPELKATRLVAVTGYCDEKHRQLIDLAGFDEFLAKPCSMQELQRVVERAQAVRAESAAIRTASERLRAESIVRRNELNELYEWSRLLIERSRQLRPGAPPDEEVVETFVLLQQEYELIAARTEGGFYAAWTCESCASSGHCEIHPTTETALSAAEAGARQHHRECYSRTDRRNSS